MLEQALDSLTELQRKVVYLFFYKDLCQTEIGKLGLSQRKISRIVASAARSMRKHHGADRGPGVRVCSAENATQKLERSAALL